MRRRLAFALLLLTPAAPAVAQTVVTSAAPDRVNVTIYRDVNRGEDAIDLDYLGGYALVSETRTIDLPAGEAVVRFEGVADSMIAVSAIVTGLPGGTVQKNRDAALLSPASLLDGTLGNRVTIRRTNPANGAVVEEPAVIRSGSGGAVVLQTAAGYEALRCTGLPETINYAEIPSGLSSKPVMSVTTRSPKAARATVTLTYLATGYDWTASYVARVADDGRTLDLFAWMTVANGNSATYPDASLMAIAGEPNIESDFDGLADVPDTPVLSLRCFPTGSGRGGIPRYVPPPPSAPPAPMMAYAGEGLDIIVTAQKRSASMADAAVAIAAIAEQEGLGDLKLYRVPVPVTVAANAQKQVALLVKDKVPFERIHRLRMSPGSEDEMETTTIVRMVNKEKDRLGIPLPSGQVAVFERALGERLLAGNGQLRDHAVGETVNLEIGESSQVQVREENYVAPYEDDGDRYRLTVSNANPFPVKVEIGFYDTDDDYRIVDRKLRKLPRKDGLPTWVVTVPANSEEKLYYRVRDRD